MDEVMEWEERSVEEMVRTEREDDGQRDDWEEIERAVVEECEMTQGRVEEEESLERRECQESEDRDTGHTKRARAAPTLSD